MARKKAVYKKGGVSTSIVGPVIPESLYDLNNTHKIYSLQELYNNNLKLKQAELEENNELLNEARTVKLNEDKIRLAEINQRLKYDTFNYNKFIKGIYIAGSIFEYLFANIVGFFKFLTDNFKAFISFAGTAGQGAFAKIIAGILLILFVLSIILGTMNIIHGVGGDPTIINNNAVSKSIVQSNNNGLIQPPMTFLARINKFISDLIPNEYKYKLIGISNSITYITSGKNQYDDYLIPRNELTIGRNDNIFNIKVSENKIQSILKPRDVILNFNSNLYPLSDFNKIPQILRDDISYLTTYTIPIIAPNGRYSLDIDKSYYGNNDYYNTLNNNKINLFAKKKLFSIDGKTKDIKLNTFTNVINNISYGYSTILINPLYKGPIIQINKTNNYTEEFKQNIYYDPSNNTYYYYKKVNGVELMSNKTPFGEDTNIDSINNNYTAILIPKTEISICTFYDQFGKNNLIFKVSDARNPPDLMWRTNINNVNVICGYFYSMFILYFQQSITYTKLQIEITAIIDEEGIKSRNGKSNINIHTYHVRTLLATKNNPLLKIVRNGTLNDAAAQNYVCKDATDIDIYKLEYRANIVQKIKGKLINDNGNNKLECFGSIQEPSSYFNGRQDWGNKGEDLANEIKPHTFNGMLFELTIYDIS